MPSFNWIKKVNKITSKAKHYVDKLQTTRNEHSTSSYEIFIYGDFSFDGYIGGKMITVDYVRDICSRVVDAMYSDINLVKGIRSVTLEFKDIKGVAVTSGDRDKKIIFSTSYLKKLQKLRNEEIIREFEGVLSHELVHVFQFNGKGTVPSGLIEGIADFYRLHLDLAPPHWREGDIDKWDAGYEKTAFFLDYIETKFRPGFVRDMNLWFKDNHWNNGAVFAQLTGYSIEQLFAFYTRR